MIHLGIEHTAPTTRMPSDALSVTRLRFACGCIAFFCRPEDAWMHPHRDPWRLLLTERRCRSHQLAKVARA